MVSTAQDTRRRDAMRFVVLMGFVSLFADMVYEGARSSVGPYLGLLGASAATVGFVAGLGELVGYGLRYVTGRLADRTGHYWALTIAGYSLTLIAVPALALVGSWELAAMLVVLERLGKAVRSPARSTLLSFAAREVGAGKAFGIHEAMDQIGGITGPLLVAAVLHLRSDASSEQQYRVAYAVLLVPALLNIAVLLLARRRYPDPRKLEREAGATAAPAEATASSPHGTLGAAYWLYMAGVALVAFGLMDWALMAYHFGATGTFGEATLPIVYAGAMAADGIAALLFGTLFDRRGVRVLAVAMALSAGFAPLALLGDGTGYALAGVALWAIGMGAVESVAKATIALLSPATHRGRAYGTYYAIFGLAWWLGSWTLGALYDQSPAWAAAVSTATQLAALPLFLIVARRRGRPAT